MSGIQIAGGVIMLICSILLAIVVVLQESPQQGGLTALGGGESHLGHNQERTKDARLSRITRTLGIIFIVVTLLTYGLSVWFVK